MTMNFTDPGELRLSGQNPFMAIYDEPSAPAPSTRVNIWHVQYCPEAGPGNVLFFVSNDLTGGEARVYSDNVRLTRWLQEEIPGNPWSWAANTLPVREARFETAGDPRTFVTDKVISRDDDISLTWFDFLPAFAGITAPNPDRQSTHGHYAVYIPARRIRVTLNGVDVKGQPVPSPNPAWSGAPSAMLAWAESWVRPKGGPGK